MGTQSRGLLGGFLGQDTQVLAVCDVDTTRREAAKQRVNQFYATQKNKAAACAAYNDFRKIIDRKDIDAVCIATPDHWHAAITLAALRSGKDVYCEKPLTHNIHEAVEVMKAVDANQRVLQTGSMQRSMKEFRIACELVQNGCIGKIERVECSFGDPGRPCDLGEEPLEPGLDWNLWVGPAPMRPYHSVLSPRGVHKHFPAWRAYREFGGGMVTDWGAHHLDIAQWGLGMDGSGPVEVRPPEKPGAKRGAKLVYASGITVEHKDGFGVHFFGAAGEVQVNRGKFTCKIGNDTIASFTGGNGKQGSLRRRGAEGRTGAVKEREHPALRQQQPHRRLHGMRCLAEEAHHQRAGRRALGHLLPPDEPGLLPRPDAQVGPGKVRVRRRHGRPEVAHARLPQPVECVREKG